MGTVVRFPKVARENPRAQRGASRAEGSVTATIVILPVIRIERYHSEPMRAEPVRVQRRRRRRRAARS
jgi:hypothetical protein